MRMRWMRCRNLLNFYSSIWSPLKSNSWIPSFYSIMSLISPVSCASSKKEVIRCSHCIAKVWSIFLYKKKNYDKIIFRNGKIIFKAWSYEMIRPNWIDSIIIQFLWVNKNVLFIYSWVLRQFRIKCKLNSRHTEKSPIIVRISAYSRDKLKKLNLFTHFPKYNVGSFHSF
jgi:hypothetical protein